MSTIAIGIDLGGTRIKVAAVDGDGKILHQDYIPTNDNDQSFWKQAIKDAVAGVKAALKPGKMVAGISAPGIPGPGNTSIAYMPGRLAGLENFEWSAYLEHPTWVLNDAIAALMAEAGFGAAKNKKNAVLLTIGTGVGGAILIDGKPYQGTLNKAGHIGHITVDYQGAPDITGMPGSLEDAIGNCTIGHRSSGRYSDTRMLLQDYKKGDSYAESVWLTSVKKLAVAIASITNMLSPECIILGGGITEAGDDLFRPLEIFLKEYEWRVGGNATPILKAQFGDMAGAVGAATFARMKNIK